MVLRALRGAVPPLLKGELVNGGSSPDPSVCPSNGGLWTAPTSFDDGH